MVVHFFAAGLAEGVLFWLYVSSPCAALVDLDHRYMLSTFLTVFVMTDDRDVFLAVAGRRARR
jgi:hypothetical protein